MLQVKTCELEASKYSTSAMEIRNINSPTKILAQRLCCVFCFNNFHGCLGLVYAQILSTAEVWSHLRCMSGWMNSLP